MEDMHNAILDKAQHRFDRFGFRKTTMDEVSRDCGISKKTLYSQFQDKQRLFDALFVRECQKVLDDILARVGAVPDPLDRLCQLVRIAIEYFNEDNFLTRLLKNDDALFSALMKGQYHARITNHLIRLIGETIAEGKAQGKIRAEIDEQIAAYIGLRLFQAFSYMRSIPFDPEKEQSGYYTQMLLDYMVNAISVKKQGEA